MTIPVRQKLVSSSKYSIKCPFTMVAEYITIHNTANDASAENEIAYMIRNNNQVSYHFAIDDKEVVQGIPLNRNAWHCGDGRGNGNMKSIGIEICYSKSGGERYKKAEELSIKFIAQLLRERGWGIDRVKTHQQWSGKYCPHRILAEGRLPQVLKAIENELKRTSKPSQSSVSPTKPTTSNHTYTIKAGDTFWGIAKAHKGITVEDLQKANPSIKPTELKVGQVINLPVVGGTTVTPKIVTPQPTGISVPNPTIRQGAKGTNVRQLQEALNHVYFRCTVDGIFGPQTLDALRRFQSVHANPVDGIYGPKTAEALRREVAKRK